MTLAASALPVRLHKTLDHLLGARWRTAALDRLHEGTNLVVRLAIGRDRLVVRIPLANDAALQVDRLSELAVLRIVARAGLAPEVIASETGSGLLITRWLEGETLSREAAREETTLQSVARLLRTLHGLSASTAVRRIDLPALIEGYLDRLAQVADPMTARCRELQIHALHLLSAEDDRRVLCHCDPHHRNIVRSGTLRLVDWEYAGLCNPLFDLAGYASYHDLDPRASDRLLAVYSAGGVQLEPRALQRWRWLFDYVWLLWLRASTGSAAGCAPEIDSASLLSRLETTQTSVSG